MSIFRSGLVKAVVVKCVQPISGPGFDCRVGETYEVAIDLGTMYVLRLPNGGEAVVNKSSFAPAPEASSAS